MRFQEMYNGECRLGHRADLDYFLNGFQEAFRRRGSYMANVLRAWKQLSKPRARQPQERRIHIGFVKGTLVRAFD